MSNEKLKEEVELLERKVKLLKEYVELQEMANKYYSKRVEYVPVYPQPYYPMNPVIGDFPPIYPTMTWQQWR